MQSEVYPRVCGGTLMLLDEVAQWPGLSPRVRGNRPDHSDITLDMRSIPACAGEPAFIYHACADIRVYPRVCGGTSTVITTVSVTKGLSPRVRGNPNSSAFSHCRNGSIPACAGEPVLSCSESHGGLSPRVRGNQVECRPDSGTLGSIPACAGEPFRRGDDHYVLKVYPRVCGGTKSDISGVRYWTGLSPRVRGNQIRHIRRAILDRSIPACAGEPSPDPP